MKRKIKMFLSLACISSAMALASGIKAEAECYGGKLDYIACEDGIVITGYENNPVCLDIPCVIDGKNVTEIRENAFYKCETLKEVTIPETVKRIGHHAFCQCGSLEIADIRGDVTGIEEGCFSGCKELKTVSLPDRTQKIGKYGFYQCGKLESVELPKRVSEIDDHAFAECRSLTGIELSEKTVKIGEYAFYDCDGIKSVYIPESVDYIGVRAFGYSGSDLKAKDDFAVFGKEDSLAEQYARQNSFFYYEKDAPEKNKRTIPVLPAAMSIMAIAGLSFHCIIDNMKKLMRKYEYEC